MGKSKGSDDCCDERRYNYNSEKDDNNNCADDTSDNSSRRARAARKIGTLDNRTTAFIRWLQSIDKQYQHNNNSLDMPIILRRFIKDRRTILYDKNLESEIDVEKLMKAFHFVYIATLMIVLT